MHFNRARRLFVWVVGFFVLFTLVGFFVLPPIVKTLLTKKLSQAISRPVTVQQVRINPYSLTFRIEGVAIQEKASQETFIRFRELMVALDPTSLVRRALILRKIRLMDPYLHIVRDKTGTYNFSDLLEPETSTAEDSKKKTTFRFSLSNIQLMNGSLDFLDGPKNTLHTVRRITVEVPFLSNIRNHNDIFVQPQLSASINGSDYVIKGKTKPFQEPYESYVDIDIAKLDIAKYMHYIPLKTNFIVSSMLLDLNGKLSFMLGKEPALVITGTAGLSKIAVDNLDKKPILKLPTAVFVVNTFEPFKKSIHVSSIYLKGPEITLRRQKNGFVDLAAAANVDEKAVPPHSSPPKDKAEQSTEGQTFEFTLDDLLLEGGIANFEDHSFAPMVSIPMKDIFVRASRVSTLGSTPGDVSLSLAVFKKGVVGATGTLSINPLSLELAITMKSVSVAPFQPYFQDQVKIAITRGNLSGSGNIFTKAGDSGKLVASYRGEVLLSNFSSIDRMQGDPFLEWKSLAFSKIEARFEPLQVHVGGISLTDFYSRIVVNADGSTNLQKVLGSGEAEESQQVQAKTNSTTSNAKESQPPDIGINAITVQGGRVDFADRRIKPTYKTELSELGGHVSNISLKKGGTAQLEVLGKIEKHIPLKITGTINPSPKKLFVDLTASFRDLDISPMTPYSSKYAGYTIEKGKLSLDLNYMINDRKLDSQNLIFLDQFAFGDRVESPDATGLPVRLAVALLKDRNGQIKLDIPVSGSIDDPQFKVGRVILQIIVNLISKAATSPFTLLASLFGANEELGYVEFDYGSNRLDESAMKKIQTLAKALYERPALKMDIEGRADVEKDREALRQNLFKRKIKMQKLNAMLKERQRPVRVDDIKIESDEYDKYLSKAYAAEKFPKPRNILGLTKTIPPSEMEKLMLTNIIIKDDDLRTLALERAKNVADALLKSQNVSAERIFVTEPKSPPSDNKRNGKDSRVDFRLK